MYNGSFLGFFFGLGSAIVINQIAWWLRLRCLVLPVVLGTVWAVIATVGLAYLAKTASGFADGIPQILFGVWLVFLLVISPGLGVLYAEVIPCRWGAATATILFETLMACVGIYFANTLFRFIRLSVSGSGGFIDNFEDAARPMLVLSLLLLVVLSPIWRINRLDQAAI